MEFQDRGGTLWRCYDTVFESYIDHAVFIVNHYSKTGVIGKEWYRYKHLGGYGGKGYWKHIYETIKKQNLQKYDY
jgi:hypothetical protein